MAFSTRRNNPQATTMDAGYFTSIGLALAAVACFVWGAALLWWPGPNNAPRTVKQRIRSASDHVAAQSDKGFLLRRSGAGTALWGGPLTANLRGLGALRRLAAESGSKLRPGVLLGWCTGLALAAGLTAESFGQPALYVFAATAISLFLPLANLLRLRRRRLAKIEEQIPDALDLMARALQAGRALSGALRVVALEGAVPIAEEFRTTIDEVNFGISEGAALANMASRVKLPDLRYFVVALLIQREAGGNLAQILTSISALVRERIVLRGAVRVMSAEGRMSAWVLGVMPFLIGGGISLINPAALQSLWTDPVGVNLAAGAALLMTCGAVWMVRIVRIRV